MRFEIEKKSFDKEFDNKFSIIIPSWNNLKYLKKCIESIRKNSFYNNQIIVHVNEGKDGTEEYLNKEEIDYTKSSENFGVCYSCNLAYTLSKGENIIFINDDMYVLPDWDKRFMEYIEKKDNILYYLSGLNIEPRGHNENVVIRNYGDIDGDFREEELLRDYKEFLRDNTGYTVNPPNVLHRDVWALIGGFSPEFMPGMASDDDFLIKLWQLGIRDVTLVGSSAVYHFMSKSVGRIKKNPGSDQVHVKFGISNRLFRDYFIRKSIGKRKFSYRMIIGKLKIVYKILFDSPYKKIDF